MQVDPATAAGTSEYGGKRYFSAELAAREASMQIPSGTHEANRASYSIMWSAQSPEHSTVLAVYEERKS